MCFTAKPGLQSSVATWKLASNLDHGVIAAMFVSRENLPQKHDSRHYVPVQGLQLWSYLCLFEDRVERHAISVRLWRKLNFRDSELFATVPNS